MLHFVAILVMIAGLGASFLTYIGTMHYGALSTWLIVAGVGIAVTVFTRRSGD